MQSLAFHSLEIQKQMKKNTQIAPLQRDMFSNIAQVNHNCNQKGLQQDEFHMHSQTFHPLEIQKQMSKKKKTKSPCFKEIGFPI